MSHETEKTAPCPFCRSTHEQHRTIEIDTSNWAVVCDVCEAIGPSDTDPARAVAMWGGALGAALNAGLSPLWMQRVALTELCRISGLASARCGADLPKIESIADAAVDILNRPMGVRRQRGRAC